jgi:hypothetical protein
MSDMIAKKIDVTQNFVEEPQKRAHDRCLRAQSCTAETYFVHYMALYVRYSLSCSSDLCTLYVPPMFLLLIKMSAEVTKFFQKKKKIQKIQKIQKININPKNLKN